MIPFPASMLNICSLEEVIGSSKAMTVVKIWAYLKPDCMSHLMQKMNVLCLSLFENVFKKTIRIVSSPFMKTSINLVLVEIILHMRYSQMSFFLRPPVLDGAVEGPELHSA